MIPTLYGITSCQTVGRARAWLAAHRKACVFHDFKTAGIDAGRLSAWVDEFGWERVLNRSGTTFRKLPEADRADLDAARAIALMLAQPSMIKRPLLDLGDRRVLGFRPEAYAEAFGGREPSA